MAAETIEQVLAAGPDGTPASGAPTDGAPAIAAPGRRALTHGGLRAQCRKTAAALNSLGIDRQARVAIVLPNGPEMAAAYVAVAAGATAAPLNPAYRADEFRFFLEDLGARALLVEAGSTSPAVDVAAALGIPVMHLRADDAMPAGAFRIEEADPAGTPAAPARADDVALVLHTSGTTSRPKIVPLTQRNVCASAANIVATLGLSRADRCLNIMPLFHIHGLQAAVLASLAAGGSVFCTPGFNALSFFGWLRDAGATWYSAVPTMHQTIVARAARNTDSIAAAKLRFIRSSSSSLPPQVMAQLEDVFGCPVIESYGMTEAAHQMTSNLLPPAARKAGSVGIAAGPQVATMDAAGTLLAAGTPGEVVIRGANVTLGYESNPKANEEAFADGWFRTGDLGVFDGDGYLSITGRLKEIINRGGEKISPRELDEALLDHPGVAQAVAFAVPHSKLGEDVAAAIVRAPGPAVGEQDLRQFLATRLADFKVPRTFVFVDEIPKGPTGKLQRIGLAVRLGLGA